MAWVVDTCLVIDVLDEDPTFGLASARLLDARAGDGLVLCPVSYIELAPAFLGDDSRQRAFLEQVGIDVSEPWTWSDTQAAHKAWARHVERRRARRAALRPIADILIGAFAANRTGLLTRNPSDFNAAYPSLRILTPAA
jgi:predicted nucleic acid-binding protein